MRAKSLQKCYLFFILNIFVITALSTQLSFAVPDQVFFNQSKIVVLSRGYKHKFTVEIAETDNQRARGLMFRRKMADRNGMLFLFQNNQIVTMWMKNTFIPLDILFIDQKGFIVHIAKSTVPHSLDIISSHKPVVSALELNAGMTDNLNIHVGDKIEHPFFVHKSRKIKKYVDSE